MLEDLSGVCSVSAYDRTSAETEAQWACLASLSTICVSLVEIRVGCVDSFAWAEELTLHTVIEVSDEASVALVGDLAIGIGRVPVATIFVFALKWVVCTSRVVLI